LLERFIKKYTTYKTSLNFLKDFGKTEPIKWWTFQAYNKFVRF